MRYFFVTVCIFFSSLCFAQYKYSFQNPALPIDKRVNDLIDQLTAEEKINFEEGKYSYDTILNATEVIKSPGIPEKAEIVNKLEVRWTIQEIVKSKIIRITKARDRPIVLAFRCCRRFSI